MTTLILDLSARRFIDDMLRVGCKVDAADPRKLHIPAEVAEKAGVLPGYFRIGEPVNGVAKVEKFLTNGTLEWVQ